MKDHNLSIGTPSVNPIPSHLLGPNSTHNECVWRASCHEALFPNEWNDVRQRWQLSTQYVHTACRLSHSLNLLVVSILPANFSLRCMHCHILVLNQYTSVIFPCAMFHVVSVCTSKYISSQEIIASVQVIKIQKLTSYWDFPIVLLLTGHYFLQGHISKA